MLTLTIAYAGRLEPQAPDRETIAPFEGQRAATEDHADDAAAGAELPVQQPQLLVSAGAGQRLRDGAAFASRCRRRIDCVASGELEPGFPAILAGKDPTQNRKLYVFTAAQPLRYLAFILSRFARAETTTIAFPAPTEAADGPQGRG